MPHFIIHCSENILQLHPPEKTMKRVHDTADATGLFAKGNIKVRMQPFAYSNVGGTSGDFVHVFGHIMGGRTTAQKKTLSHAIVKELKLLFPSIGVVSMNVDDFEKASYCNQTMV